MDETRFDQKRVVVMVGVLALLLAAAGCAGGAASDTPTPPQQGSGTIELTIAGSGTTTAVLEALGPAFEADTPGYRLSVLPGAGTGGGVEGIIAGSLNLAAMARPPKDEESAKGVEYTEFGLTGVAIYTHPGVGVTDLTTSQIAAVFGGGIENWSEVGGPELPIVVYVRDEGDSSTKALREGIFGEEPFPVSDTRVLSSQSDMQQVVAETVGCVGFGSWASAVAAGTEVQAVSIDGVSPEEERYPYMTPMGVGYMAGNQSQVQPLLDWLLSESGQAAMRDLGVVIP